MKNVVFAAKNFIRCSARKHFEGEHNFFKTDQNLRKSLLHKI